MAAQRCRQALSLCALVVVTAAACDGPDGTDPYALWETFDQREGAFHFHYPAPPWEGWEGHDRLHAVLVLEPDPDGDAEALGPGAAARLEAWAQSGRTPSDIYDVRRQAWEALGYSVEGPELWENGGGDEGILLRAASGSLRVREAMLSCPGGAAAMSLWGSEAPDDPDMVLLLDGFAPGPSGGAP
jgi:hypothetical protein